MIRELKPSHKYGTVLAALSALSLVSFLLFGYVGELAVPFASAFLAVIFVFEAPKRRIVSFIVPLLGVGINVLIHGLYMLFALEIVLFALIISLCYVFSETKNVCAVYLSLSVFVFLILSFYFSGVRAIGSFDLNEVIEHYSHLYTDLKIKLAEMISSIQKQNTDGSTSPIISASDAGLLIDQYSKLATAYAGVISFLIAGIALKLFNFTVLKISKNGIRKTFALFFPSSAIAYSFVIISLIAMFIGFGTTFAVIIHTLSEFLMFVFAYVGIKYFLTVSRGSEKRGLILAILIFGFLFMTNVAVKILSYFGAWIVISTSFIKPKDI